MAATDNGARTSLASMLEDLLGTNLPVAIRAYDGSRSARPRTKRPRRSSCVRPTRCGASSPRRASSASARAYVAGDLDVEGDIFDALSSRDRLPEVKLSPKQWAAAREAHRRRGPQAAAAAARGGAPARPAPLEGARRRGDRHHYDVSNDFYRSCSGRR